MLHLVGALSVWLKVFMLNLSMSSVSIVYTVIAVLCEKESFRKFSVILVTESKKERFGSV